MAIARYQTLSQCARGAASASPVAPNGRVTAAGSKIDARADRPDSAAAPAPAIQTISRDAHSACHAAAALAASPVRERAGARASVRSQTVAAWVACRRMPDLILPATLIAERYRDEAWAVITIVLAVLAAALVGRALSGRARKLAAAVTGGELSPVVDTRLTFLRRMAQAAIIVIGIAIALAQVSELNELASTVLASSAIAAAVIGFAARQVLANAIAGIVLAVTQPLRIGDLVTFEEQTGTVEDVSLTYTWVRMGSEARLIIPNERLASGILRNDSIRSPTVALEVSIWLAPDADETRALEVLGELEDARSATIAEVTETGVRVAVAGPPVPPAQRLPREAELRRAALAALRAEGIPRAGAG